MLADQQAEAGVLMGGTTTPKEQPKQQQEQQQGQREQQRKHPGLASFGFGPAMVDGRSPPVVGDVGGGSPSTSSAASPRQAKELPEPVAALFPASEARAASPSLLEVEASPRARGGVSPSQSPAPATAAAGEGAGAGATAGATAAAATAAADLSLLLAPARDGRFNQVAATGDGTAAAPGEAVAARGNSGGSAAGLDANPEGKGGAGAEVAARASTPAATVSAAVSEDLAYVHRGSVLQSYAITGSVLVAASPGARARLRVTDRDGHIASATSNAAVATENAASSIPPTREYWCKAAGAAAQPAGAPPKFLPTLMYRCSPAVKILPVRVVCRLRSAGNSVLVWAQLIANPQLSQSLSGVSVAVNLPFSPRSDVSVFDLGGRRHNVVVSSCIGWGSVTARSRSRASTQLRTCVVYSWMLSWRKPSL